ncbi:signal peptidase-like protein [Mesobacillus boroniphilus JCM 21738]|uniref:Signal peptidase-like protein n=1 Tax=Mesobacillus boroniphilus JCM 21738 TaxID=1294265 RepID=W4RW26_9BACI|nr:signal peptidase-like protein [Mesobacillus boroniphilus JCM 21738]
MYDVVGVRFKKAGKIYYFDPGDLSIQKDEFVIVETVRGVEYGRVVTPRKQVGEKDVVLPLKKVVRIADQKDRLIVEENKTAAKEAYDVCSDKVNEHQLDMKLVDVEYTFDRNKVIFYFTADGRIDFRELVKDLARFSGQGLNCARLVSEMKRKCLAG